MAEYMDRCIDPLVERDLDMSFSEYVMSAALDKIEDAADIKAYNESLMEADGARYSMDDVMRMAMGTE